MSSTEENKPALVGRFAPTPSGKLHCGNAFSFLVAYLVVKQQGGIMRMRVEDLDKARCKPELIAALFRDLEWLGFTWEGEVIYQSKRDEVYEAAFERLIEQDLVYPCFCSRADLHSASAPHSGEALVYPGTCRNLSTEERKSKARLKDPSFRLRVTDEDISFNDSFQGYYSANVAKDIGDFIVRRSDSVFAYQLAVVCDDADMGITSVVRGYDLLSSTINQIYLDEILGYSLPSFGHVPLFVDATGRRLAKRSGDVSIEYLRTETNLSPEAFWGVISFSAGLLPDEQPISLNELCKEANLDALHGKRMVTMPSFTSKL